MRNVKRISAVYKFQTVQKVKRIILHFVLIQKNCRNKQKTASFNVKNLLSSATKYC